MDIVVYQPGRVGSTVVVVSLRKNGFDKTFHVHHYDEHGSPYLTGTSYKGEIENPKYITIVRDPVARNLSSFSFSIKGIVSSDILNSKPSDEFKADYFMKLFQHNYIIDWFKTEFKKYTDIDIYSYKFDKAKGYSIYDNLLVIRCEDLTRVFPAATKEFLGKEIYLMKNKREIPPYINMAKYLPESYFTWMYVTHYMHHFYTQYEIDNLITKWKGV